MQAGEGFDEASRAQRATYARGGQEWDYAEDLPPELVCNFYEVWREVEAEIERLQTQKKTMLSAVRTKFGRHQAEALKIAMCLMGKDQLKRVEEARFKETASRYVHIIEAAGYECSDEWEA